MISSDMLETSNNNVIIHVFVVGFHHKKGCVVEYVYPPLSGGYDVTCTDLPDPWKHLPTLALPDGAHNYEEDTVYFHLPSLEDPNSTIFGISCYRQMDAQNLLRRSSDITRDTVQKSVCVLSRLPLYGLIQAKLELITHAYFDERDFSKVSLLEETYTNLNSSLPKDLSDGQQSFLGLSVRDFVLRFKHKSLLLFKLLLLERKVLFYKSPVKYICSTVLTLCSLIPGMIEMGFSEAATSVTLNCLSDNTPETSLGDFNENHDLSLQDFTKPEYSTVDSVSLTDKSKSNNRLACDGNPCKNPNCRHDGEVPCTVDNLSRDSLNEDSSFTTTDRPVSTLVSNIDSNLVSTQLENKNNDALENDIKLINKIDEMLNISNDLVPQRQTTGTIESNTKIVSDFITDTVCTDQENIYSDQKTADSLKHSTGNRVWYDIQDDNDDITADVNILDLDPQECGLPLAIFTKGILCHPYLSLPFLDVLSDVSVRGFYVGATNILFKQKKHLFDVIVEVDDGKIDVLDPELKKRLYLTTADLRFADYLVRHVMEDKKDVFLDGTGWEGGDEWLRSQFKLYLLRIMRTSLLGVPGGKEAESFNISFMNYWKTTHNYRIWSSSKCTKILDINPGHPFDGQLSMADMKLKFSHSMQSSEKGRRINSAVVSTGKVMMQTGKAVGGAFVNARSMVSSWLSSFSNPQFENRITCTDDDRKDNRSQLPTKVPQIKIDGDIIESLDGEHTD